MLCIALIILGWLFLLRAFLIWLSYLGLMQITLVPADFTKAKDNALIVIVFLGYLLS